MFLLLQTGGSDNLLLQAADDLLLQADATAGGFRSRIAGGLVVTAS